MLPTDLNHDTEGQIVKRQSTFVRVCTVDGAQYKIRYVGKKEYSLDQVEFKGVSLSQKHPLLKHHLQRSVDIFISSSSENSKAIEKYFLNMVQHEYNGWREPSECFNTKFGIEAILSSGFGLLYSGPEELAKKVELVLTQAEIRHSIQYRALSENSDIVALLLGENVVVANGFVFEQEKS